MFTNTERDSVALLDVESILRRKMGSNIIVETCATADLVSPGENYGSTIMKVDVSLKRDVDSQVEDLHLVGKMIPPTEMQRLLFDTPFVFPKEIFMFEKIMPAYKTLELECGIPENQVFNCVPEFFGSRLSMDQTKDFDENAVILMQNLEYEGYKTGKRLVGYNLAQSRLIMEQMARFHALGIGMKNKRPEFFEKIRTRARNPMIQDNVLDELAKFITMAVEKDEKIARYKSIIESHLHGDKSMWWHVPPEPWGTIIHCDLWVNNIMICEDANKKPVDVKFIDFQNYLYSSPLRDMIFFIASSCDQEVRSHYIDDLIDLYYNKFISHLELLGCDTREFSRSVFDEQLAISTKIEFIHCLIMMKVMTVVTESQDNTEFYVSQVFAAQDASDSCLQRMAEVVLLFAERKWI